MNSTSTQYITARRMGLYEPIHQFSMWVDFKSNDYQNTSATMIIEVEAKLDNQVPRRLAQNHEFARKSHLQKKAYVQQLEASRSKLLHLEQELEQARQQSAYTSGGLDSSHLGYSGTANSDPAGIAAFQIEYGHWVKEQTRQTLALRTALQSHLPDIDLRILVDGGMNHYFNLFHMKATVAKADVFYLMSGMWKTSIERFFLWIGGFFASELLKVLVPQLGLLDHQVLDVYSLTQACQQAEDALSQGMEKLQQTLAETVVSGQP